MRLSLIGMSGSGKSYWSLKLAEHGFRYFGCDDLIAEKLAPELSRPDGTTMEVGEWMGFPYELGYHEREARYLAYEKEVLTGILKQLGEADENVVIDTTGSVIYTGEELLRQLRRCTTMVYLSTPPELRAQMLAAYIANQRPVLWNGLFSQAPGETNEQALARCYSGLLSSREQLYQRYADVVISPKVRTEAGFGVADLLKMARSGKR